MFSKKLPEYTVLFNPRSAVCWTLRSYVFHTSLQSQSNKILDTNFVRWYLYRPAYCMDLKYIAGVIRIPVVNVEKTLI